MSIVAIFKLYLHLMQYIFCYEVLFYSVDCTRHIKQEPENVFIEFAPFSRKLVANLSFSRTW